MLIVVIFPSILETFAKLVGIVDYKNGLYAAILFGLIILSMYLTMMVSELSQKNRVLIQEYALLEKRIREIEERGHVC